MELLVILIALGLVQIWGSGGPVQQDQWFERLISALGSVLEQPRIMLVLLVGIPCLSILLLFWLLEDVAFGLPSLALAIIVLLYSLGRGEFSDKIQTYLNSWNQGNFESAYEYATAIGDFQQSEAINDYVALHEQVRRTLLYEGFERWFAVVFWFLVLGPVGALAYRLSYFCGRSSQLQPRHKQLALRMVHYLDWLPVRLLAFSFNLAGDFVCGFNRWLQVIFENLPAMELLDGCGCAAMNGSEQAYPVEQDKFIQFAREQLLASQALLSRSVIVWLIIIALLQFTFV